MPVTASTLVFPFTLAAHEGCRLIIASMQSLDDFLRLKQLPDQLLEHKDMEFCPNIPEPTTEELDPIPEQLKLLMIIGVVLLVKSVIPPLAHHTCCDPT